MNATGTTSLKKCRELDAELADIKVQIRAYPQPIAGCDAQYQYLSDRRAYLVRKIRELKTEEKA